MLTAAFRARSTAFIVALQESLISLAPYIVLASMAMLLAQLAHHYDTGLGIVTPAQLTSLASLLLEFASICTVVVVAYHFSLRYDTEQIVSILLSLAVYSTVVAIANDYPSQVPDLPNGVDFVQIALPIVTVMLFRVVSRYANITIPISNGHLFVARIFEHIYSFAITYLLVILLYLLLRWLLWGGLDWLEYLLLDLPGELLLAIRTLLSQAFWYVGIHGPRMMNALLDPGFIDNPMFPNLSFRQFYRLFAACGGSGMGISMLIALFVHSRNRHVLNIARLSVPFVVFNINTLIIYGLPIVLNRFLLLPFLLVPVINMAIAYVVLSLTGVGFLGTELPWTTPALVDGYLSTGGNLWVVGLQVVLIGVGVAIYLPYVRRYVDAQTVEHHLDNLGRNLGIVSSLKSREGLETFKAQHSIIESNFRLGQIIKELDQDHLMVYYQPKVDIVDGRCDSFEALLRLRLEDGRVVGPFFLDDIERAGIVSVIDLWVCEQVNRNLERWKQRGFRPWISVNLHPDTLQERHVIQRISEVLRGQRVEFEILEKALVSGREARDNLELLKDAGFRIAIDDFGEGYFSYKLIYSCRIDTIKIDKSLVGMLDSERGQAICRHAIELCQDLDFECVVEGVETREQLDVLRRIGARYVQGFVFAPALSPDAARRFDPARVLGPTGKERAAG